MGLKGKVPDEESGDWRPRTGVYPRLERQSPLSSPRPLLTLGPAAEPLHRVLQELTVGREPELVLDGLAVRFDGFHRQGELLGDFARAHAAPDHVQDLDFPVREA